MIKGFLFFAATVKLSKTEIIQLKLLLSIVKGRDKIMAE